MYEAQSKLLVEGIIGIFMEEGGILGVSAMAHIGT